jgi:hypothetical protein
MSSAVPAIGGCDVRDGHSLFSDAGAVHLINQGFSALKDSLLIGIQHGFIVLFVVCLVMVVAAFFLKDVPLSKHFREEAPAQASQHAGAASKAASEAISQG